MRFFGILDNLFGLLKDVFSTFSKDKNSEVVNLTSETTKSFNQLRDAENCSRTNSKLFANSFDFVRELFLGFLSIDRLARQLYIK